MKTIGEQLTHKASLTSSMSLVTLMTGNTQSLALSSHRTAMEAAQAYHYASYFYVMKLLKYFLCN